MIADLKPLVNTPARAYRLINAKYPPINIFEDVASIEEFEALFAIQELTNPRLRAQIGDLSILPKEEIPFEIPGCSYATAPFTHVNPDGSRFSDGTFGVLYLASCEKTAVAEVYYHQKLYWSRVPDLHYERLVFKSLVAEFTAAVGLDARELPSEDPIYHMDDYAASRMLGIQIKTARQCDTLAYKSVRNLGGDCYALFTPRYVRGIVQSSHFEMIWDGKLNTPNRLTCI